MGSRSSKCGDNNNSIKNSINEDELGLSIIANLTTQSNQANCRKNRTTWRQEERPGYVYTSCCQSVFLLIGLGLTILQYLKISSTRFNLYLFCQDLVNVALRQLYEQETEPLLRRLLVDF